MTGVQTCALPISCPGGAEPAATSTNCPRPGHRRFHPLGWLLPPEEQQAQPPLAQPRTSAGRVCLCLGLSDAGDGRALGLAPSCPGRGPGAQTSLFLAVGIREFQGGPKRAQEVRLDHLTGVEVSSAGPRDSRRAGVRQAGLGSSSRLRGPLVVGTVTRGTRGRLDQSTGWHHWSRR